VATAQVATTGLLSLAYIHRVSDKVSLAADFLWNWTGREAAASFGKFFFSFLGLFSVFFPDFFWTLRTVIGNG
jgi:hypothetical protein